MFLLLTLDKLHVGTSELEPSKHLPVQNNNTNNKTKI